MSISHCYCSDYMTKPTQFGDEPILFPNHQITRKSYSLLFSTLTYNIILICQRCINLSKEYSSNSGTFFIDGIQKRIGDILYALQ